MSSKFICGFFVASAICLAATSFAQDTTDVGTTGIAGSTTGAMGASPALVPTPGMIGAATAPVMPAPGIILPAAKVGSVLSQHDLDKDGRLSVDEFMAYQQTIFTAADKNADQMLDVTELMTVVQPPAPVAAATPELGPVQRRQAMAGFFTRLDVDGDGKVSESEANSMPRFREQFSTVDTNADKFIDMAEFEAIGSRLGSIMMGRRGNPTGGISPGAGSGTSGSMGGDQSIGGGVMGQGQRRGGAGEVERATDNIPQGGNN